MTDQQKAELAAKMFREMSPETRTEVNNAVALFRLAKMLRRGLDLGRVQYLWNSAEDDESFMLRCLDELDEGLSV